MGNTLCGSVVVIASYIAFPLRARFNCAGVGKSKFGFAQLKRARIRVIRGRPGTEANSYT